MQNITQNNTTNITDELKSLEYVDLIHELANTGVSFKSHIIKLVNADKYLADNKCSICLEEYDDKKKIQMLGCNHIFHEECISRYLADNKTCAICRTEVDTHVNYENMSIYIAHLQMKCDKSECFYFSNLYDIIRASKNIKSLEAAMPSTDSSYTDFKTNIETTEENKNYTEFVAKHLLDGYQGKKQELLIKLFSDIIKIDNSLEPSLVTIPNQTINAVVIAEKYYLNSYSCPYPECLFHHKEIKNLFPLHKNMITDNIVSIIIHYLPLGSYIISTKYSFVEKTISIKVKIKDMNFIVRFAEEVAIENSQTAKKCWYNILRQCNNHVKAFKILDKYPLLVADKSNKLYFKNIDSKSGEIIFFYDNKFICVNTDEFSERVNDFNVDFDAFKNALERNGINPKYLIENS